MPVKLRPVAHLVALAPLNLPHHADFPLGDRPLYRLKPAAVAQIEHPAQPASGFVPDIFQLVQLVKARGQRLFGKDVQPALQAGDRHIRRARKPWIDRGQLDFGMRVQQRIGAVMALRRQAVRAAGGEESRYVLVSVGRRDGAQPQFGTQGERLEHEIVVSRAADDGDIHETIFLS